MAATLWCAARATSLRNGLVSAVQLGGDTDTVAVLVGGLIGGKLTTGQVHAELPWHQLVILPEPRNDTEFGVRAPAEPCRHAQTRRTAQQGRPGGTPESADAGLTMAVCTTTGSTGVRRKPATGRLNRWSAVCGGLLMAAWASAAVGRLYQVTLRTCHKWRRRRGSEFCTAAATDLARPLTAPGGRQWVPASLLERLAR